MKRSRGFTLIELMITVAIIGILAAIVYPSYRSYVVKSNRKAAQAIMLDIDNREKQYLLDARAYTNDPSKMMTVSTDATHQAAVSWIDQSAAPPTFTTKDTYTKYVFSICVANTSSDTKCDSSLQLPQFVITATAAGIQASDGSLTLNSTESKSPANKW